VRHHKPGLRPCFRCRVSLADIPISRPCTHGNPWFPSPLFEATVPNLLRDGARSTWSRKPIEHSDVPHSWLTGNRPTPQRRVRSRNSRVHHHRQSPIARARPTRHVIRHRVRHCEWPERPLEPVRIDQARFTVIPSGRGLVRSPSTAVQYRSLRAAVHVLISHLRALLAADIQR
jgi:hypothetical protein